MFTKLHLKNFKSHRSTAVNLGRRITILIGPNGSGKSSLLQALMLLKQSLGKSAIQLSGPYVHVSSQEELSHGKNLQEPWAITVAGEESGTSAEPGSTFENALEFQGAQLTQAVLSYSRGQMQAQGFARQASGGVKSECKHNLQEFSPVNIEAGFTLQIMPSLSYSPRGRPQPITQDVQNQMETVLGRFREMVSSAHRAIPNCFLVPPVRGLMEPVYPLGDTPAKEIASPQILTTTWEYERDRLEDEVARWAERVCGVRVRVVIKPQRQVALETVSDNIRVNVTSDGFGVNQLLHLLTQLSLAGPNSTVMIEEPEIHLHPKAQKKLVDEVFIEASKKSQLILTTHSEHILFSCLNHICRGDLVPDSDLRIWAFGGTGSQESPQALKITNDGMVVGDIPGFFDADMDLAKEFAELLHKGKSR